MNDDTLLDVLHETAASIREALGAVDDWGLAGSRSGQHHSDLAADAAALDVLERAGVGVLSEESGPHHIDRDLVVVLDPLDGSTNAAQRIPWYATSMCAVDGGDSRAALVVNLVTDDRFEAVRGGGARRNGHPVRPSECRALGDAVVGLSGYAAADLGWRQYRALGAIALDLCAVASGSLDGFVDCSIDAHGPWDYLGGALICREAGASVADADQRELVVIDHSARRTPVAAATPELLTALMDGRRSWSSPESAAASSL